MRGTTAKRIAPACCGPAQRASLFGLRAQRFEQTDIAPVRVRTNYKFAMPTDNLIGNRDEAKDANGAGRSIAETTRTLFAFSLCIFLDSPA
jgi:hypothetical protein